MKLKIECGDKNNCVGKRGGTCCARALLSMQPNILAQKSTLQEAIEMRGHHSVFLPKFHCECNFIEYFWGETKRYARSHCSYSIIGLREVIPEFLASVSPNLIWKYWNRSQCTIQAYWDGLIYGTAEYTQRV